MAKDLETLNKPDASRELEGKRTTGIRPASLRRAQVATSFTNETITDFISNAVDGRVRELVKKHSIRLPKDAEFSSVS